MADEGQIVQRIRAINATLQRLQEEVVVLSAEREALVRELRSGGWSLGTIADATGLSRSRVHQIAD